MADSPNKNYKSGIVTTEISIDGTKLPEAMMILELEVVIQEL